MALIVTQHWSANLVTMTYEISAGDTAWVLTSAALVLLMTPGLAFFYGGMVRAKGVLNMLMMNFITMGTVGVLWVLYGYSMAFGNSVGGVVGNPLEFAGLTSLMSEDAVVGTVPALAFVAFQACFAIIAVALVSGAIADRATFSGWVVFTILWATLVYFPAAHWVFAFDGTTAEFGGFIANSIQAIDFAGGTAIHINAGAAALALAIVVGKRLEFGVRPMRPHNMTLVMLGAALLWFGWFGFNAGSALGATTTAAVAWVNTLAATAAAMLAWLAVEKIRDGHPTSLGAASGIVAGLVGITPAAGSVSPLGALVIGILAGVACAYAIRAEEQARLRRLARRRRRPPRRWPGRHPADRPPRRPGIPRRCRGPVLRRRVRSAAAPVRRSSHRPGVLVRGDPPDRLRHQEDDRLPGQHRGRTGRHRHRRALRGRLRPVPGLLLGPGRRSP
jgi:Amt family ammonium transporter